MDSEENTCCRFANQTYAGIHYCEKRGFLLSGSGDEIRLRQKSLSVFRYLSERADQVVTKDELILKVWGKTVATDDSLAQCIADIRRALGDSERKILRTEHRRGYRLIRSEAHKSVEQPISADTNLTSWYQFAVDKRRRFAVGAMAISFICATVLYGFVNHGPIQNDENDGTPSVSIVSDNQTSDNTRIVDETRVALSRYSTVRLVEQNATYELLLNTVSDANGNTGRESLRVNAELIDISNDSELMFADAWTIEPLANPTIAEIAARIAAAVASPGGGAIGNHLLARSRHKNVEELTPAECYAHGYGCKTCSGEEESITPRARECLDNLLHEDPEDARAWALKSAVLTRMKWFGIMVSEEQRNDPAFMRSLENQSMDAANRAEAYSDGTDSAIYWGMAQSYITACHADKLQAAVQKGLQINPDDPSLLGSFGNWLAYSGFWEEGVSMVNRAMELEPKRYKKFWLYAPAKLHYIRDEYQAAYDGFLRAYNDRNWLSHLQLAYTLPYLDRLEEAKHEVARIAELFPSMSRTEARRFYRNFCFKDDYIDKMDAALAMAGMNE